MNSCFILTILAIALMPFVLCEIPKERYEEIHKICAGKSGVAESAIEGARKGDFENTNELKQYILCIWQEEKCIVNGKVDEDECVQAIPPAYLGEFEKPVRECIKHVEEENQLDEATFKATYCIYTKTTDRFFLP